MKILNGPGSLMSLLNEYNTPAELYLPTQSWQSVASAYSWQQIFIDESGPFLWFHSTKIRPPKAQGTIDLSKEPES